MGKPPFGLKPWKSLHHLKLARAAPHGCELHHISLLWFLYSMPLVGFGERPVRVIRDVLTVVRPLPVFPVSRRAKRPPAGLENAKTESAALRTKVFQQDFLLKDIRITGLLIASPDGSGKDLGRHQSAINSNARSDVPTQAIYRPIGITIYLCAL
jgi:hypothetical protein